MNSMFKKEVLDPVINSLNKFGDRNSFCINEFFYTYNDLGKRISAIKDELDKKKLNNKNIGLVINDDIDTYASIFALWLSGFSYVPLHPNWPIERCKDIIQQIECELILDSSLNTRYVKENIIPTSELQYQQTNISYKEGVDDEDLAYILFTSGSTGKPKGVQLMRKNVGAFMKSFWDTGICINEKDRCLQCFDLTFDVSVQSYLVALTKGACVYTVPYNQPKYVYVSGLIEDHGITFGAMAPSMLRYLKPYFNELNATSLKTCILTAEACPVDLMEDWFNVATNTDIYDFYGPTEATIYCTYYKLTKGKEQKSLNGIISIGKPMSEVIGLVLDENGNELPYGEKGELCVAGNQLTKGYFNNPGKNAESFFIKKYNGTEMRFYHTGDLCYKDEEGDILYSGRLDHQAKIQGYRVEMGEIEFHARTFLEGINVVCLAFDAADGLTQIAMFIEKEKFNTDDLISYLKSQMPQYMIPSKIIFVPVFTLNGNDKIDKNILKKMI